MVARPLTALTPLKNRQREGRKRFQIDPEASNLQICEMVRPNFNQVFRASLSICPSISLSTVSTAYFWRIFEKCRLSAAGNGPRNFKSFYH
jgi:hypothetical protein